MVRWKQKHLCSFAGFRFQVATGRYNKALLFVDIILGTSSICWAISTFYQVDKPVIQRLHTHRSSVHGLGMHVEAAH